MIRVVSVFRDCLAGRKLKTRGSWRGWAKGEWSSNVDEDKTVVSTAQVRRKGKMGWVRQKTREIQKKDVGEERVDRRMVLRGEGGCARLRAAAGWGRETGGYGRVGGQY